MSVVVLPADLHHPGVVARGAGDSDAFSVRPIEGLRGRLKDLHIGRVIFNQIGAEELEVAPFFRFSA